MSTKALTIEERLDKIKDIISDQVFLENKGIANEAGIYLFCYDPEDELKVLDHVNRLCKDDSLRIIRYDLFGVFMSLLEDARIIDKIDAMEEKKGSAHLLEQLNRSVTPRNIVDKMLTVPHKRGNVVFITGVGGAHPFIRSHDVLNNMHSSFDDVPVILFYPGEFDGQSPKLFGRFNEGNYYRAFNLLDWRLSG